MEFKDKVDACEMRLHAEGGRSHCIYPPYWSFSNRTCDVREEGWLYAGAAKLGYMRERYCNQGAYMRACTLVQYCAYPHLHRNTAQPDADGENY